MQLYSTKYPIIDVWDVRTFGSELLLVLENETDTFLAYYKADYDIFISHDLGRERSSIIRPENPYATKFHEILDVICSKVNKQTIRAFHYTRMTDDEIAILRREGIHVSTPETLRQRLQSLVNSGRLTHDAAERFYADSPFQSCQIHARSGKFWLTSHPVAIDDSGVAPLMERWGGEVASMHVRDTALSSLLLTIGEARIIEVAVPLCASKHSYCASNAIVASFARACGAKSSKSAFDLYVENALPPTSIIAVHTKGDITFENMGRIYPEGYVNIDMD